MYKSKSYKPQLRIGLSRSDKPRANSPIKITPAPGIRPRSLGLSRSYKIPQIDNLLKNPIITQTNRTNTLPEEVRNLVQQPTINEAATISCKPKKKSGVRSADTFKKRECADREQRFKKTANPGKDISFTPTKSQKHDEQISAQTEEIDLKYNKFHDTPKALEVHNENEDVSISYSPLDIPANTRIKVALLKAKRLILGRSKNSPNSRTTSSQKALSAVSNSSNTSTKRKTKFSRLSLKKSRSFELTDDESEDDIKPFKKKTRLKSNSSFGSTMSECSVVLDRLSKNSIGTYMDISSKSNESKQNDHANSHEKMVEFIDLSQNSQENINIQKLINDIISLEQVLKSRRIHLDALKQSIIYKKKHDAVDLISVTNIWKNGCKLALNDLLIQLRKVLESNTMDGLLKQLNIPEHIFKFDPETNEFI